MVQFEHELRIHQGWDQLYGTQQAMQCWLCNAGEHTWFHGAFYAQLPNAFGATGLDYSVDPFCFTFHSVPLLSMFHIFNHQLESMLYFS
jgi:hypothetical protein